MGLFRPPRYRSDGVLDTWRSRASGRAQYGLAIGGGVWGIVLLIVFGVTASGDEPFRWTSLWMVVVALIALASTVVHLVRLRRTGSMEPRRETPAAP